MAKKKRAEALQASGTKGGASASSRASAVPTDVWERIAWTCLHLLVFLVPIGMSNFGPFNASGAPLTYDQFDIVKVTLQRGLMLLAFGSWLIGILLRGGKVRFTRVEWLVFAFLGWVLLSAFFSVHPSTAIFGKYRRFEGLISFITYGVTFFVALQLADRPSRMRSLARTLAIGGFIVALYGALQVIGSTSVGVARVLQPLVLVGALGVTGVCTWLLVARGTPDPDDRAALLTIGGISMLAGVFLFAGLGNNIGSAVARGLSEVPLDPVSWGTLPFETNRAFAMYGNPDLLGGYMIFPWAVAIALAITERNRTWRTLYWVFTFLNAFVGLTSYVRGAWIGATVAAIAIVVAYLRARSGSDLRLQTVDKVFMGAAGFAAGLVVLVTSFSSHPVTNVMARVVSIFNFTEGSAATRFQIWQAALAAVAERPILGWGADTFRLLFPRFKPAEYVEAAGYISVADNVHNYPLQLASGIGIPGALMLYALFGWVLVTAAPTVFARGKGTDRLLMAGFWAAILGYATHLLFGLSVTGSTVFLWLAMGVVLSPSASAHEIRPPKWGPAGITLVAAVVLVGSLLNVRYIVADHHFLMARIVGQGDPAIARLERAIEINPYNDMYRLELGSAWHDMFREAGRVYQQGGWIDADAGARAAAYFERAERAYRGMLEFAPMEYDTYVFMANIYNEAASYLDAAYVEQAIDIARRGVEVQEYGPAVRVQLALAYLSLERVDEAIAELEFATSLDSKYAGAHKVLGDAYLRAGRVDDARAAYTQGSAWAKNDPSIAAALEALDATGSGEPSAP